MTTSNSDLPEILYIAGFGRSGTTILHILLANQPGVFGAGEPTHIFRDGFARDEPCSCGRRAWGCEIWSHVLKEIADLGLSADELVRLRNQFEAHGRFPFVAGGHYSGAKLEQYRRVNRALFSSLARVAEADVIIDSSKYAGRAIMLDRIFPGRVRVLFVTRSPAGLMGSFRKPRRGEQRQKSVPGVVAYHAYVLACLRIAATKLGDRALHLRYDDLVVGPDKAIAKIERWWGRDLSRVRDTLRRGDSLDVGHIITGNRIRKQEHIVFDPSAAHAPVGPFARLGVCVMAAQERVMLRTRT